MFESAVKSDCEIAIFNKEGKHVNGLILEAESAIFLAEFVTSVASAYEK